MTISDPTDRILTQGRALVHAIEALGTIQPTGPFERALARMLMGTYKRRLRAFVKVVPTWVSEEVLSASEHIRDDRAVLWTSNNGETCPPRKTRLNSFAQRRASDVGTDVLD